MDTTPLTIDAADLAEFQSAVARVNSSADALESAQRAHNAAIVVYEYVGGKIREKYGLDIGDTLAPDGTITKAPKAPETT